MSGVSAVVMKTDNQRGFMFLSAIFLTLIVALMAQIILHANSKVQQRNSTLYFTAINLANEQFAILESGAKIDIPPEDKKSYNGVDENSVPIEFDVSYNLEKDLGTLKEYKVTVIWTVNGETEKFESTKIIKSIAD